MPRNANLTVIFGVLNAIALQSGNEIESLNFFSPYFEFVFVKILN